MSPTVIVRLIVSLSWASSVAVADGGDIDPGKPLGFLDANIRCGDALFGVFDLKALETGIPDVAYKPLAGDDQSLRDQNSEYTGTAGARNVDTLQSRMISDVVRSLAMSDLPHDVALIEIDGRDTRIRRFLQRQSLNRDPGASALTATARGGSTCGNVRISRLAGDIGEIAASIRIARHETERTQYALRRYVCYVCFRIV